MELEDLKSEIDEYEKYFSQGVSRENFETVLDFILQTRGGYSVGPDYSIFTFFYKENISRRHIFGDKVLPDIISFLLINKLARVFTFEHIGRNYEEGSDVKIKEVVIVPSNEIDPETPSKYYYSSDLEDIMRESIEEIIQENYIYYLEIENEDGEEILGYEMIPDPLILSDIVEIK